MYKKVNAENLVEGCYYIYEGVISTYYFKLLEKNDVYLSVDYLAVYDEDEEEFCDCAAGGKLYYTKWMSYLELTENEMKLELITNHV